MATGNKTPKQPKKPAYPGKPKGADTKYPGVSKGRK